MNLNIGMGETGELYEENEFVAVIRHQINRKHVFYQQCCDVAHLVKNLYNYTLYPYRQYQFQKEGYETHLSEYDFKKLLTKEKQVDWCALPNKVSKMTVKRCYNDQKSYEKARRDYYNHPEKYKSEPKMPYYLKKDGYSVVEYYKEALLKKEFKDGILGLSGTSIKITVKDISWEDIIGARIVPRNGFFIIEIIYKRTKVVKKEKEVPVIFAGIDVGVNNLVAFSIYNSIQKESINYIVNGRPLKSINQYRNKNRSKIQEELWLKQKARTSKRLEDLERKRINRIGDYLYKTARRITDEMVFECVDVLYVGHNNGWKQDVNLGDITNQNFVLIPFNRFIEILKNNCAEAGIKVVVTTEEYTSKSSFIHNEPFHKYNFIGKRNPRGLLKTPNGNVNSDVNGALNMIRKNVNIFDGIGIEERKKLVSDPFVMDIERKKQIHSLKQ